MSQCRVLNGRVATKAESERDEVVFYIPDNRSTPYSFGQELPVKATITLANEQEDFPPAGTAIKIVQAELIDDDVVLGFVYDLGEGICALGDVELGLLNGNM